MGSVFALVRHHWRLSRTIQEFYLRLEQVLGAARPNLDGEPLDALAARYRELERQLLLRWDAPLINDFFAMIFFGVLGKLSAKWCGSGSLGNDLLCGAGQAGMISAEPALRVRRMADLARGTPLVRDLQEGRLDEIERGMTPEFRAEYASYLDKFGDRCLEELKLESSTLFDDPLLLLRSVGALASRPAAAAPSTAEPPLRAEAEERVRTALRWRPMRRAIYGWVLTNARARVRDRENLRFERTRLFGRVRSLFIAIGKQLHLADRLDEPRDVFWLEVNELLGFIEGTSSTADLRGLVAVRKAEFDRYRTEEVPADRFETHGAVHQGNRFRGSPSTTTSEAADADRRTGIGCCPGTLRGPVRVVSDPRNATLRHGDILVAERTDPGWIMLFPSAAALLVERGSLLSHSAIVARELGLPAIVSIAGLMSWLKDGDWVEMDGSTGVVTRIAPPEARDGK